MCGKYLDESWEIQMRSSYLGALEIKRPNEDPKLPSKYPDEVTNHQGWNAYLEVGTVRSSNDGGDSITPQERRDRTFAMLVRRTRAGIIPWR
jgi:hypothetical protein